MGILTQAFETLSKGEKVQYPTGSRRDSNSGRGRFDLLPWYVLDRWAQLMERGADKYGDENWKLGQPLKRYFNSAVRHLYNWLEGDRVEDHLAAVLFNVGALMWTEQMISLGRLPSELNNILQTLDVPARTREPLSIPDQAKLEFEQAHRLYDFKSQVAMSPDLNLELPVDQGD